MYEWIVVSVLFLALVVTLCRRGHRHFLIPWMGWTSVVMGGVAGWLLESMPLGPFAARPSVTTLLAVGVGLFTGRVAARSMSGWARGVERDLAAGAAPGDARMIHPVLGTGLVVFGSALFYVLAALRFESLEILNTPRDESTTVVLGGEEVRLEGDAHVSHAVLLIHGFPGSPADLGDLPQRLNARGLAVRSLRLPGHATGPTVIDEVTPDEYATAVDAAREDLAARHNRVSIVGFSFGGALAIRSAAAHAPYRLVVVNPYLGKIVTPPWCPIDADTLLTVAAATTPRVMKPNGMIHLNDLSRVGRLRVYSTQRTKAATIARDVARSAATPEVAAKLTAPTLMLLSNGDRTTSPSLGLSWFEALPLPAGKKTLIRFDRSDHILFHDFDREEACAAVVGFLTAGE